VRPPIASISCSVAKTSLLALEKLLPVRNLSTGTREVASHLCVTHSSQSARIQRGRRRGSFFCIGGNILLAVKRNKSKRTTPQCWQTEIDNCLKLIWRETEESTKPGYNSWGKKRGNHAAGLRGGSRKRGGQKETPTISEKRTKQRFKGRTFREITSHRQSRRKSRSIAGLWSQKRETDDGERPKPQRGMGLRSLFGVGGYLERETGVLDKPQAVKRKVEEIGGTIGELYHNSRGRVRHGRVVNSGRNENHTTHCLKRNQEKT